MSTSQKITPGSPPPLAMNAVVVPEFGLWTYRNDVPVPEPGPNEVRIAVEACGICGTDVHIAKGDASLEKLLKPPFVQGHEFCGRVDKLGAGVANLDIGTLVSAEMHEVCHRCPACRDGKMHACANTRYRGLSADGSFADYVCVSAGNVVVLPQKVPVKVAAFLDPLGNAVHTACKVPVAGKRVLVAGYGAIGAMVVEIVAFLGAREIHVMDVKGKALKRAEERAKAQGFADRLHAHRVIHDHRNTLSHHIIALTDGGVDVAMEISGHPDAINDCIRCTRAGGDVVLLGIPTDSAVTLQDFGQQVIFRGLTLHAIIGREMMHTWDTMIGLLDRGLDTSFLVTSELALSQLGEGYARLATGNEQKVVLYPGWDRQ
jgi:threonine 3-dehydrogenase